MKKETFESNRPFAGPKKATMKRRQVGHDYTRRGLYLVTMAVEGRRPLFGRVGEQNRLLLDGVVFFLTGSFADSLPSSCQ